MPIGSASLPIVLYSPSNFRSMSPRGGTASSEALATLWFAKSAFSCCPTAHTREHTHATHTLINTCSLMEPRVVVEKKSHPNLAVNCCGSRVSALQVLPQISHAVSPPWPCLATPVGGFCCADHSQQVLCKCTNFAGYCNINRFETRFGSRHSRAVRARACCFSRVTSRHRRAVRARN